MKRYNVYFDIDSEIEIGVIVTTEYSYETQRDMIIEDARNKLRTRGHIEFTQLICSEVSFLEEV